MSDTNEQADTPTRGRPRARDLDTRVSAERPRSWLPPQLLPDPNPEPGYSFRWIRISTMGVDDPMNVSSKLREGWEPVKASEHPEIQTLGNGTKSRFPDSIEIGGLILCKTPIEFVQQRNAYYLNQANGQMNSIDNNFMRDNDPRMPLFKDRRSEVSFGRGS